MSEPTREEIKDTVSYFKTISEGRLQDDPESLQERVRIIQHLEEVIKQDFKSTDDFHKKMGSYFMIKEGSGGVRLRNARMEMGITQKVLAEILGISKVYLVEMEHDTKTLSKPALTFIYEGFSESQVKRLGREKSITFGIENKGVTRAKKRV